MEKQHDNRINPIGQLSNQELVNLITMIENCRLYRRETGSGSGHETKTSIQIRELADALSTGNSVYMPPEDSIAAFWNDADISKLYGKDNPLLVCVYIEARNRVTNNQSTGATNV